MELPKSTLLIFTLNHENSYSADKTFTANLNANKDFMFGSLAVAYGKKISRTLMPTVKAFYTIYGRNAGQGVGLSVGIELVRVNNRPNPALADIVINELRNNFISCFVNLF